jgi:hypothetical protein
MSAQDIALLIAALAAPDASRRETAARELFGIGAKLASPVIRQWMAERELAACFDATSGLPRLTVGAAVAAERFEAIRMANGSPPLADVPPDQDAKEFELEFSDGVRLDVLTSRDPNGSGAIARYLAKFGQGIQQVEVETRDVDRATELLGAHFGLWPVYPSARPGANRTRVNFFLIALPSGSKILIELVSS